MSLPTDPSNMRNLRTGRASRFTDEDKLIKGKDRVERKVEGRRDFKEVVEKKTEKEGKSKSASKAQATPKNSIFDMINTEEEASTHIPSTSEQIARKQIEEKMMPTQQKDDPLVNPMDSNKAVNTGAAVVSNVQAPAPIEQTVPIAAVNSTAPTEQTTSPAARVQQIQEIVDQIVDKVYTLKTEGQTDTLITVKHPAWLNGAEIKLTSYESAKGEFNIAFGNLTQEAKGILDRAHNALSQALDAKGFTVHIVTTSTLDETLTGKADPEAPEGGEEGEMGEREGEEQAPEQEA